MINKDYNNIIIKGAKTNNLKDIDIEIEKNKITVFVGISGSGKTSLVFDTIAAESMNSLYETFPSYVRSRLPVYHRPEVKEINGLTTAIVVDQKLPAGDIRSTVGTVTDISSKLRLLFSRFAENRLEGSANYSFNDPMGMCTECSGLGKKRKFNIDRVLNMEKSLNDGAIQIPGFKVGSWAWQMYANSGYFDNDKPLKKYSEEEFEKLYYGTGKIVEIKNTTGKVWDDSYNLTYEGLMVKINRYYLENTGKELSKAKRNVINNYTVEVTCDVCGGKRLKREALESKICNLSIWDMGQMDIDKLYDFFLSLSLEGAKQLIDDISAVLGDIVDIGLGYLNLNRISSTLSGGEIQRLKIIKHLRSSLVGLTYIFDEPSAGLHPKDIEKLNKLFLNLRDKGNTVLIVEHNRDIISVADHVIEMGLGAGDFGGHIVFSGDVETLKKQDTYTGRWMMKPIKLKRERRISDGMLALRECKHNNLKNINVNIPKNVLTVITGPAGSGKSTLVSEELPSQYSGVVYIGQKLIGTSNRSNTASYIGIMDDIRKLYAKESGQKIGLFSFNSAGACPMCKGRGVITTEMAFMDPITVTCEHCGGNRYSDEALRYKVKGYNISQIMKMTVSQAIEFFDKKSIVSKLKTLEKVGLGYMTLGQPTGSMSGGEVQKIKLASHLNTKNGIYVIDEPTIGLHGEDVKLLIKLMDDLVSKGNTVIVVEHNQDVIAAADWVIDLGPDGGNQGGNIVFEGTPFELVMCGDSITGKMLNKNIEII